MRKLLAIIVLGLMISGCATSGGYKKVLDTWVGSTENQLVSSWGPPLGSYVKDDGSKILTYQQSGSYDLPGTTVIDSMTGFPTTTSGPTVATSCRTRFYISPSGKIKTWDFQGNSCTAVNPESKFKLPKLF